jgi:multidrug efflux system outer membrane protein
MARPVAARLGLALLAGLLGGCQLAPRHETPPLPTAAHYPPRYADLRQGAAAPEIPWRTFLRDPQLQARIGAALQHNRDLRIAVARIEEARGQFRIQRAGRYPTLGVTAEASRGRFASFGTAPAGGSGEVSELYSVGLGVSAFELDFWGRVRNLGEAARSRFFATLEAQRAFRLSLMANVAASHLALHGLEARIELAEATLQSRRDGLRIARVRFDAGITSALDLNQADALLSQAETELARLRLAAAEERNLLVLLVGSEPDPTPPATGRPLAEQIDAAPLSAGLPSDLLLARPDIRAAERRLRAARADIGVARAAFFPQISLTGSLGYLSTELGDLVSRDNRTWSIGPSLSLPLFDFGRNRGNLTVAEAREHIAVAEYEKAIQTAFREVADALAARRYLAEQHAAQARNLATLQRIAELASDRYAEGVVNYLQVLDAERERFAAEQALIQVQSAQAQNLVALYIALGGGSAAAGEPVADLRR